MPTPDYIYVDRAGFRAAVAALADGAGPVGVDAERASGIRYWGRAYLVQMHRAGAGTFLFDPLSIGDFAPLQGALRGVEWVFHAASQDLRCLREIGLNPGTIFDTEVGARLAGLPRVGLGGVALDLLGVVLKKEHSAADWSTRPLPESWLEYAALDVALLPQLRDVIAGQLAADAKLEFAYEEFWAELTAQPKPPEPEPWRRLSGISTLRRPRQLAVARALWQARDLYAQSIDTSPGRVIPDSAIVVAAAAMPDSAGALTRLRGFTGRSSRSELSRWVDAARSGLHDENPPAVRAARSGVPPTRGWRERHPHAFARLEAGRAVLAEIGIEWNIPRENLLPAEALKLLAWRPPTDANAESFGVLLAESGARHWQVELSAARLAEAFAVLPEPAAEGGPD